MRLRRRRAQRVSPIFVTFFRGRLSFMKLKIITKKNLYNIDSSSKRHPHHYLCHILYIKCWIKSTADSLLNRRQGISPSVDIFLDDHGDEQITQFIISRNVINRLITSTLNLISANFKNKNNNNPLYHLKILIKTDWTSLSVEKNSRITISRYLMNNNAENMYSVSRTCVTYLYVRYGRTVNANLDLLRRSSLRRTST
jgi:hypothetical protein